MNNILPTLKKFSKFTMVFFIFKIVVKHCGSQANLIKFDDSTCAKSTSVSGRVDSPNMT